MATEGTLKHCIFILRVEYYAKAAQSAAFMLSAQAAVVDRVALIIDRKMTLGDAKMKMSMLHGLTQLASGQIADARPLAAERIAPRWLWRLLDTAGTGVYDAMQQYDTEAPRVYTAWTQPPPTIVSFMTPAELYTLMDEREFGTSYLHFVDECAAAALS
jgi:capsular polysaccharide biosynthesis protein